MTEKTNSSGIESWPLYNQQSYQSTQRFITVILQWLQNQV